MSLTSARYWDLVDVKRSEWDPRPKKLRRSRAARTIDTIQGVEVHYAGDSNGTIDADPVDRLNSYKRYHVRTKGWSDLFYNVAFAADGRIFEGRYAVRMSQISTKRWLTCICLCGTEPLTLAQRDSFGVQIEKAWLAVSPDRDPAWLRCHRDRGATACPGDDLAAVVGDLRKGWSPTVEGGQAVVSSYRLRVGSRGHDVAELQHLLNFWTGAGLDTDGIWGRETQAAVLVWEERLGVLPDAVWSADDREAHKAFVAAATAAAAMTSTLPDPVPVIPRRPVPEYSPVASGIPAPLLDTTDDDLDLPATQSWVTDNFIAKV